MPRLPAAILIALSFFAALPGCERAESLRGKKKGSSGVAPFVVDVLTIKPSPYRETLSATGSLVAREAVQLQSERAGVVKEILFEEGQPAKAGDVLLEIDGSELSAQRARALAGLRLAEAAQARQVNLLESKGISQAEFDQSQANLDIAKAEVAIIESQLAKTAIRAPFDGVAGLRRVSVGTYLTPGTVIGSFQDINSLKIDFSLPERYLNHLRVGQKVTFAIAGRPEKFNASVAAIEPSVDVQTRSLLVRAIFSNEGQRLFPGSFAEVEVVLDEIADAILIPPIALIPGLKQQTVLINQNGTVEERRVLSGLRTSTTVQIVEGLKSGDALITSGILQLRPGMKVQVKERAPATTPMTPSATPAREAAEG